VPSIRLQHVVHPQLTAILSKGTPISLLANEHVLVSLTQHCAGLWDPSQNRLAATWVARLLGYRTVIVSVGQGSRLLPQISHDHRALVSDVTMVHYIGMHGCMPRQLQCSLV
jgi:hypothetical protein